MREIVLNTPTMQGKIYIGTDVLQTRLPLLTAGQKNFVVTDSNVYALYADFFARYFDGAETFVLPSGEENKTFPYLQKILEKMASVGLHRSSRLFAVGGGVVGDIRGLAATLYMPGIACVQIPTTLLAQVDSSVGGKTAVDMAGVKNIVGAFYQPQEVLVDPTFLKTLPARELKCGIGEIVKYAGLNADIFDALENASCMDSETFLCGLIADCIAHKAQVVQADEKETGERKSLNLGHTTGHAIELAYGYSHGECVLFGLRFETLMAMERGVCERAHGERFLRIVDKALACAPVLGTDFSEIENIAIKAKADKKNTDDGEIVMAVAKSKGEWTLLALPYETYVESLVRLAQGNGYVASKTD